MGLATIAIIVVGGILLVGAAFAIVLYVDFLIAARASPGDRSAASRGASKTPLSRR